MRKAPSAELYKLLYTRSGNICAYSDCYHPIFNDDGIYVAELCHIKAANKGGSRYDKEQSDEDRRALENLLFLCHRHHKETDDVVKFPVEKLIEIKNNHEKQFTEKGRQLTHGMIKQIIDESNYYWIRQKEKNFELEEFKMNVDFDLSQTKLFNEIIEAIKLVHNYCKTCSVSDDSETLAADLSDLCAKAGIDYSKIEQVPYYLNPFSRRNWSYHNIGLPNLFTSLMMKLFQLRVNTFETLVELNPSNQGFKKELNNYRKEFEEIYDNSYHVD